MLEYQETYFQTKMHVVAPVGGLLPSNECRYCNLIIKLLCGFHFGARAHEVIDVFGTDQA